MMEYLAYFLLVRVASIFLVRTSYVPDEYWQSTEVAHRAVYRKGYLTWEWRAGLRSYTYPSLFALLFRALKYAGLDSRYVIITSPRCLQALFSVVGDLYTVKLSGQMFGERAVKWTAFSLSTSWFLFYCASRTLTNTMETSLTAVGLFYYQRFLHLRRLRHRHRQNIVEKQWIAEIQFLCLACISVAMRPTAMVQWTPLCAYHLFKEGRRLSTWIAYAGIGLITLAVVTIVDYSFYGQLMCTTCNFVRFNVMNDQGSFYGSHAWHWYWTQGFWVILGPHLLPFILESRRSCRTPMFALVLWQIAIYSFLSHKEFRFLLPILPLCNCFVGRYLSSRSRPHMMVIFLAISSLPLAIYTGLVHQRGTLDSVNFLAEEHELHRNVTSISFLMPCHSTPLYSHLHHQDIHAEFLTCEPEFRLQTKDFMNSMDEADRFHLDPEVFLLSKYRRASALPSHIVLFDRTSTRISNFLAKGNYTLRARLHHAHFVDDDRLGDWVHIYHRSVG